MVLFLASGSPLRQSGLPAKCQIVCGGAQLMNIDVTACGRWVRPVRAWPGFSGHVRE